MSDCVTHLDLVDPYGDWRRGEPVAPCAHCGEPIFEDEGYYEINYEYVHEDCARDYAWEIAGPVHHE